MEKEKKKSVEEEKETNNTKEKEFKKVRLETVLIAIIVILVFVVGFLLGARNNTKPAPQNNAPVEKPEDKTFEKEDEPKTDETKEETTIKELSKKEVNKILDFFQINEWTIEYYGIGNKLQVTYDYLIDINKDQYTYDTCSNILKDEFAEWEDMGENNYYLQKNNRPYNCYDGENHKNYVIPYAEFSEWLEKLFNEEMSKNYGAFYYIESLDGIAYLPYTDGTGGPYVSINEIKDYKEENNIITINIYLERVLCEDRADTYLYNCGKSSFKLSGTEEEIKNNIINNYLSKINLYKITITDKGEYKTLNSIEKQ